MKAPVYVLLNDVVQPRRRMVLRQDTDGLVHWVISGTPFVVPYCFDQTLARMDLFQHGGVYETPTCVWCVVEPCQRCEDPGE